MANSVERNVKRIKTSEKKIIFLLKPIYILTIREFELTFNKILFLQKINDIK